MSTYRAQVHIDAPLDEVWALVGNPATSAYGSGGGSGSVNIRSLAVKMMPSSFSPP